MSRFRIAVAWLGVPVVLALTPQPADAQCACTITDLGTLGGFISSARAINSAGQVVGESTTSSGNYHAFLWTAATGMVDLGTLGGPESFAYGINDAGQVVGVSDTADTPSVKRAFLWTAAAGMVDLGTLGGPDSYAYGINNAGQVVGTSETTIDYFPFHAFLWTATAGMIELGSNYGIAINNVGQVVLQSRFGDVSLWTAAGIQTYLDFRAAPADINDSGQIVGTNWDYSADNTRHGFLWTAAGGRIDLGSLDSTYGRVEGINNLGQVVGAREWVFRSHAFLWTTGGGMIDLGSLTAASQGGQSSANDINDAGQVVGWSAENGLNLHAVLWQPAPALTLAALTSDATFPVPAGTPVTWTTSAAGGVRPYWFKFWIFNGSTWTVGRDWSTAASWTWEPAQSGTYNVQVWARSVGSPNEYDAWQGASATISTPSVLTVTAITPSTPSAAAGTSLTWTALADGGTGPYTYRFFGYDGATWTVGQEWSPANTWRWTAPTPGTYAFQVWARNAGSSAVYDAWRAFGPYTAARPAALTVTRLAADPPSPVPARTPVTWTATAAGGTGPYTYKFWLFDGVTWAVGQDWSLSASWTWLPSSPGNYHVQVWARNAGSATAYDAYGDADATMTAPAALQAGLGSDRTFPVPASTPITWTARGLSGTGPYSYKFWVFVGSTWSVGRDWNPTASWTWLPSAPSSYFVQAWIRNAGSLNEYDAWTGTSALPISSATAVPVTTVTVAPMSPLFARESAVVTATATGGSGPYTYQFWVYDGSTWTIGQAWSASSTFTWQPPSAGTYWIQAWVRNAGTTSSYDAWNGLGPLTILP